MVNDVGNPGDIEPYYDPGLNREIPISEALAMRAHGKLKPEIVSHYSDHHHPEKELFKIGLATVDFLKKNDPELLDKMYESHIYELVQANHKTMETTRRFGVKLENYDKLPLNKQGEFVGIKEAFQQILEADIGNKEPLNKDIIKFYEDGKQPLHSLFITGLEHIALLKVTDEGKLKAISGEEVFNLAHETLKTTKNGMTIKEAKKLDLPTEVTTITSEVSKKLTIVPNKVSKDNQIFLN